MKMKMKTIPSLVAVAFVAAPSVTQAGIAPPSPLTLSSLSVKLTETYSDVSEPKIKEKGDTTTTKYKAQLKKSKIDNKVIIDALVDAGRIPEAKGWKLVSLEDVFGGDYVAVVKGDDARSIDDFVVIEGTGGEQEAFSVTEKLSAPEYSQKGSETEIETVQVRVNDGQIRLDGVATSKETIKFESDPEAVEDDSVDKGTKFTSLTGPFAGSPNDQQGEDTIVQGSITEGASKKSDLTFDDIDFPAL